MDTIVPQGHSAVNPREEVVQRDAEAIGEHGEGRNGRQGMPALHGRHIGPAERIPEVCLGQAAREALRAQFMPDRKRKGRARPGSLMFSNT